MEENLVKTTYGGSRLEINIGKMKKIQFNFWRDKIFSSKLTH